MKQGIHPTYGPVVFRDRSADQLVLTRSTLAGRTGGETVEIDGTTYPVVDVDVSSASHPFWTGKGRVMDTEGRVEAFRRRYGARGAAGGRSAAGEGDA
ncbi:type B 50S ribosomal protein L31 [Nocardioides sp. ChNu-153]|uniref:type B 50S ribosomal protein L31 n=1 Tax=unclassified Nocardioides TaxID=2615069 RepID=UPI002405FD72|nr:MULTISPECIES: type B 50S ribosomal protein L31 [unclassified Nocardioides]MDF9715056.1 type B 50S ribosomal protein L31 [Nocardioides sp. ChNu-99]MDN7122325.1 type B 50S ribosomal protein L31 [Nocardioides sp. ChNu-153]